MTNYRMEAFLASLGERAASAARPFNESQERYSSIDTTETRSSPSGEIYKRRQFNFESWTARILRINIPWLELFEVTSAV